MLLCFPPLPLVAAGLSGKLVSCAYLEATRWYDSVLAFPISGVSRANGKLSLTCPFRNNKEESWCPIFAGMPEGAEHACPSGLLIQLLVKRKKKSIK